VEDNFRTASDPAIEILLLIPSVGRLVRKRLRKDKFFEREEIRQRMADFRATQRRF